MPGIEESTHRSNGARLVSVEGLVLPLREARVAAEAAGGVARTTLRQVFANPHDRPLKVTYTMPLPASGAVAGYRFRAGGKIVAGEVDRREAARERFEQALVEGRTAGLLDQERASLFTLELGNIPPRADLEAEIAVDQRLDWLREGMWEWRFPTVAAPRYLGEPGRVGDASRTTVDVASEPMPVRATLDLLVKDVLAAGRRPESPSHRVTTEIEKGARRVTLDGGGGASLDRDIVVRWAVAESRPGVSIRTARPGPGHPRADRVYGLVTIVPPSATREDESLARDLIVLLDTSGSMMGRPLDQAKRVVGLLLDSLDARDRVEMIAFAGAPVRWRPHPVAAAPRDLTKARQWLASLVAGGGTEMLRAVEEALAPLRAGAQRQVVLVTDGEIGFESEVVGALLRRLPPGSRLHAVGIGSAVNDALIRPMARAGRGATVFVGIDEDPERGAARLIAATRMPVVTEVEISGNPLPARAPRRLPDLMAGSPILALVEISSEGGGLVVRGSTPSGPWEERVAIPATGPGEGCPAVATLYAREAVEDLEMDLASGEDPRVIEPSIERIGLDFGISTRLTSWVAIATEPSVDPREPVRRVVIPQELPYGMSAVGLGLRGDSSRVEQSMFRSTASVMRASYTPRFARHAGTTEPVSRHDRFVFHFRWTGQSPSGSWVLEFQVEDEPLEWEPSAEAILSAPGWNLLMEEVDIAATTARGQIPPGSIVRLAIRLKGDPRGKVTAVRVHSAGRELVMRPAPR